MSGELLLTFYGDDFTGSTDSMEVLSLGGVPTVLFLEPPSHEMLVAFPEAYRAGLQAILLGLQVFSAREEVRRAATSAEQWTWRGGPSGADG